MSAQRLKYKGRHVSRASPSILPLRNSHNTPNFKPLEPYNTYQSSTQSISDSIQNGNRSYSS
jgi:hypothetical protein